MTGPASMPPALPARATYVYKTAGGEISADVIGASPGASKPCAIWIHGGGLIFGTRTRGPRPTFTAALLQHGFVVVSIDHRLAPETKLPAMLEDVRDAVHWVRTQGPALFGADPERLVMTGGSAGGYLCLMSGHALSPPPRAIASFWGYGDITAPWEAQPSEHYRTTEEMVTREAAERSIRDVPFTDSARAMERAYFYLRCRQQGCWLPEVTGHDLADDPAWFDAWCPLSNITPVFPPTILVHGTADTDVPWDESRKLAARLAEQQVPHEFISLEGAGHGFADARPEDAEAAERAAAAFLAAHLG
jgi:acetyl esterase/lipase